MELKTIDNKNKIVKVEGTIQDYLSGDLDKYVKAAIRMIPNKIIVEMQNTASAQFQEENTKNGMIKNATFTSVWDGGHKVTTNCKVNMETHEIFDIEKAEVDESLEHLHIEYVTVDGVDYAALNADEEDDIEKTDFWYK